MEERFEKVWDIPWPIVGIIHGYTWKWEDLTRITSKVRDFMHFAFSQCMSIFLTPPKTN